MMTGVHVRFVVATGLMLTSGAYAAPITDGKLSVNLESFAPQFGQIILNGTPIESRIIVQQQYTSGSRSFSPLGPVTANGSAGVLNGSTVGDSVLNMSVVSTILGPLASNPTTTDVLQQVITYTNATAAPVALTSVSYADADLGGTSGGDTTRFDPASGAVVSTEGTLMYALIAGNVTGGSATFGYDIGTSLVSKSFPMGNRAGPVGPDDTQFSLGYDFGTVGVGESRSIVFRYLFATNLTTVPSDFVVPEPSSLAILGLAAAGLLRRRRRS